MGKAKRKATGRQRKQRDPLDDKVAIMLVVDDCPPIAITTTARNVQSIIKRPPASTGTHQHTYAEMVASIANNIRSGEAEADDNKFAFACAAIWTAFNHPIGGNDVAQRVSDLLHRGLTPHITWQMRDLGLGIDVAAQFIDLSGQAEDMQERGITGPSTVDATGKITRTH